MKKSKFTDMKSMLNLLAFFCFVLLSSLVNKAYSQTLPNNNPGNFGTTVHRQANDSTLYWPTACGVPTDTTYLFSQGFSGRGEKKKLAAIYYDSCGHKAYIWDPASKTWIAVGSGSGQNIGNSDLTITSTNRHLSGSGNKNLYLDSLLTLNINIDGTGGATTIFGPGQSTRFAVDNNDIWLNNPGTITGDFHNFGDSITARVSTFSGDHASEIKVTADSIKLYPYGNGSRPGDPTYLAGFDANSQLVEIPISRIHPTLDSTLYYGDTAYQKDIITTWDDRNAAFSAGFGRPFFDVHSDSLTGFFSVGDVNGNRTNFFLIMSQKSVGFEADSGLLIKAGGNSQISYLQTQAAQAAGGFQQRLKLPFTGNLNDTLATRFDVRLATAGSVTIGSSTQSGTVSATTFNIAHGLGSTPTYFNVTPNTSDAQGIAWITADGTNITVHYNTAPPAGTNNLIFKWIAK